MAGTLREFAITTTKKRPRSMEETRGFAYDMVFEILTWLPAKSLVRFRCVSKTWNNLIRRDLNFFKLHNARSQARLPATRLLYEIGTSYPGVEESTCNYSTQLEGLYLQLVRPRHYFDRAKRENMTCSNHCNGLVCFFSYKDTQTYLYNVTTGEMKVFPFAIKRFPPHCPPELYLGFDPNTEKYKLLNLVYNRKTKSYDVKILTLGTNSWRKINEKYPNKPWDNCNNYVFLNGVLYWKNMLPNAIITYFNFMEETFGTITISLPQIASSPKCRLNEMQSALLGKLVINYRQSINEECINFVYDEVKKIFVKYNPYLEKKEEKVVLLEAKNNDEIIVRYTIFILATTSLISASSSLIFPPHMSLRRVSRFVENIIPLTFIEE